MQATLMADETFSSDVRGTAASLARPRLGGLARYLVDFDERKDTVEFGPAARSAGYAPGWLFVPAPVIVALVALTLAHFA
jgi:hypothetical protein